MEKKIRSKIKPSQDNNEKFQRFRSKIKKTFTQSFIRSISTPRSRPSNKISRGEEYIKHSLRHKSIDTPRNQLSDNNSNSRSYSSKSIDLHNHKKYNNFHYFISFTTKEKHIYCEFCKKDFTASDKIFECKYCRITSHKKCCSNITLKCEVNQQCVLNAIIDSRGNETDKHLNYEVQRSANSYVVKLRKKMDNVDNVKSPRNNTSFNFYNGGVVMSMCRNSSASATSAISTSSSISQNSYDFTTLDSDSIKEYNIEVNPIIQKQRLPPKEPLDELVKVNGSCHTGSVKSDLSDSTHHCKPSFIYRESDQEIIRIDWSEDDLKNRSNSFNENNFGLRTEVKSNNNEVYLFGTVLVYINLLRQISIEFTSRPISIFDLISSKENEESVQPDVMVETVYLPRGTSKRLYVNQSTNTIELINGLLKKFRIKANAKKFGLYEHTIEGERKVSVRKLMDIECPLAMLLTWNAESTEKFNEIMAVKRLVLQENETGDIEWIEFSKYELLNFLLILEREEQDKTKEIELKYSILKNEISRIQILAKKKEIVTEV